MVANALPLLHFSCISVAFQLDVLEHHATCRISCGDHNLIPPRKSLLSGWMLLVELGCEVVHCVMVLIWRDALAEHTSASLAQQQPLPASPRRKVVLVSAAELKQSGSR